jgi:bla regulator protein BlaR1
MRREPRPLRRISAAALVVLSLGVATVAAQVAPPNAASGAGQSREITLPENVLERYVGAYQFAPGALFTVTRTKGQLTVQLTGQNSVEIYPKSETSFFLKVVEASIDFVANGQGPATALVLHQNGRDVTAPRIDAATAQQANATLAERVKSQTAAPGSEAALRKLIDGIQKGMPDYAAMSPELAQATRQQLSGLQSGINALGAIQSIEFRGVGAQGADQYRVRHEKGALMWFIALAPDGKIAAALVRPDQ